MTDEKGLRFETGLIVIVVMFTMAVAALLAFQSVDARLDRIESVMDGAEPTARSPVREMP